MERKEFINSIKDLTIEELAQIIIKNFSNKNGSIKLEGLDFTGHYVDISKMSANNIRQSKHKAEIIWQEDHEATDIYQRYHHAKTICQEDQTAKTINQANHKEAEYIYQCGHQADIIHQYGHTAKQIFQKNTAEYVGPYNPVYESNREITSGTYKRAINRKTKQADGWLTGKKSL